MSKIYEAFEHYCRDLSCDDDPRKAEKPGKGNAGHGLKNLLKASGVQKKLQAEKKSDFSNDTKEASSLPKDQIKRLSKPNREPKISKSKLRSYREEKIDRNLVCLLTPYSFESERFKILKSQVLNPNSGNIPNLIEVTSALPGEGKSFVAANLAISVAQEIDRSVLLIDCDLRRPTLHTLFGFGQVPGLADYLAGECALPDILLGTKQSKLTLLPAGSPPRNPAELLSSGQMADLLRGLSQKDKNLFVILDTTPLALTAEGNTLAKLVDGILLVIKQRNTPKDQLKELIDRVGVEKFIGVVFNFADRFSESYDDCGKYRKRYYE